jgi:hypothetical protein
MSLAELALLAGPPELWGPLDEEQKETLSEYKAAVLRADFKEAWRIAEGPLKDLDVALYAAIMEWFDRYMHAYADFQEACPCPGCATRH